MLNRKNYRYKFFFQDYLWLKYICLYAWLKQTFYLGPIDALVFSEVSPYLYFLFSDLLQIRNQDIKLALGHIKDNLSHVIYHFSSCYYNRKT
jgi:hypothetical protein